MLKTSRCHKSMGSYEYSIILKKAFQNIVTGYSSERFEYNLGTKTCDKYVNFYFS